MRAAQYTGPGVLVVRDVDVAPPGPGEVAIAVEYTGVCGTDLHILHGDMDARVGPPSVIGHEMSGRLAEIGPGVQGWEVGAPVTVLPVVSCGECRACRSGHSHVCPRLVFVGIDAPGSMQNRWVVPAQLLVALPEGLPMDHAALVEPTAVAVHDVGRADLHGGEHVVVVGGGPIGILIGIVAAAAGASVVLLEPDPQRRGTAEQVGLVALDPGADDLAERMHAWCGPDGADVAFEVSGAAAGVASAVAALRVRGRMVLVAIHPRPREVDLHRFFWRELELVGARLYGRADVERAVELVATGVVPATTLISAVVPLEQADALPATLGAGGVLKVLVDCRPR